MVVVITLDRKGEKPMVCEVKTMHMSEEEVALVKKLVADELTQRLSGIEDSIVAEMGTYSSKWTEDSRAATRVAIVELVRSPLAYLERKLGIVPVEPAASPASVAV